MAECEARGIPYLFKLRQSAKVKTQLAEASAFLQSLLSTAEQLGNAQRWERILLRVFEKVISLALLNADPPLPATG
jgi:hypothetical protein